MQKDYRSARSHTDHQRPKCQKAADHQKRHVHGNTCDQKDCRHGRQTAGKEFSLPRFDISRTCVDRVRSIGPRGARQRGNAFGLSLHLDDLANLINPAGREAGVIRFKNV